MVLVLTQHVQPCANSTPGNTTVAEFYIMLWYENWFSWRLFMDRCDFSTRYNSQCYFGDFSASLSVVTHQHSLTVYHSKSMICFIISKSNFISEILNILNIGRAYTNIGRLFTERNGNQYIQGMIFTSTIPHSSDFQNFPMHTLI